MSCWLMQPHPSWCPMAGQCMQAGCPWPSSSCTPRGVKSHLLSAVPSSNSLPVQSRLFSLWSLPLPAAVGHPRERVCLTPPLQRRQQLSWLIFVLFLYKEGQKILTPPRPLLQALSGAPVLEMLWGLFLSWRLIPGVEGTTAPHPL